MSAPINSKLHHKTQQGDRLPVCDLNLRRNCIIQHDNVQKHKAAETEETLHFKIAKSESRPQSHLNAVV